MNKNKGCNQLFLRENSNLLSNHYIGSVALLSRNAKRNVNPGLGYFERCLLACEHL